MTAELANYLRRCAEPRFAAKAAWRLAWRIRSAIALRLRPGHHAEVHPTSVRRARKDLLARPVRESDALDPQTPNPPEILARRLTLIVGTAAIEKASDWLQPFPDPEIHSSLHRWSWLLFGATSDVAPIDLEEGIALMRSWLAACERDAGCAGGAYTTGERIANGLIFLARHGSADVPADLAAAFRRMGRAVAEHLEFHPGGMTGNHAFHNARALLLAGTLADLYGARDLAYAIADERLPVLVTSDGFMREGSSHYHLLFTRWVLEMLWAARRAGDEAFESLLAPYAELLVARCWFFLVPSPSGSWSIPLIGDVSPDCPVDWLLDLPWSPLALQAFTPATLPAAPLRRGWGTLFCATVSGNAIPARTNECHATAGWCRAEVEPWTLFVRARSHDGELRSGHEHCDLASYALFRDGVPFIVDCGRHDYTFSPLSIFGQSPAAHNAPIVDGLAPMAFGPTWLAPAYTAVRVNIGHDVTTDEQVVTVSHDGFSRLSGPGVGHCRELHLRRTGLQVLDRFTGSGHRNLSCRLHFGPDVQGVDGAARWALGATNGTLSFDSALEVAQIVGTLEAPAGGIFSPSYGQLQPIITLEASGQIALPATLVHGFYDEQE